MGLWQWLAVISQSAGGTGHSFTAQWQYVVTALVAPVLIGLVGAGIIIIVEKIFGFRLSGGSI
jgi:hypothetical protein